MTRQIKIGIDLGGSGQKLQVKRRQDDGHLAEPEYVYFWEVFVSHYCLSLRRDSHLCALMEELAGQWAWVPSQPTAIKPNISSL